jgi:hypothetical protein
MLYDGRGQVHLEYRCGRVALNLSARWMRWQSSRGGGDGDLTYTDSHCRYPLPSGAPGRHGLPPIRLYSILLHLDSSHHASVSAGRPADLEGSYTNGAEQSRERAEQNRTEERLGTPSNVLHMSLQLLRAASNRIGF